MKNPAKFSLLVVFFTALNFGFLYCININGEFDEVVPSVVSDYISALEKYRSHPSKDNRVQLEKTREIILNKTGLAGYKLLGKIKDIFYNGKFDNCTGCDSFANFVAKYQEKLDADADTGFNGLMYEGTNETIKCLVNDYQKHLEKLMRSKSVKDREELENQYNVVIAAIGLEKFNHLRRFKAWVDDYRKYIFSSKDLYTTESPVTTLTLTSDVPEATSHPPLLDVVLIDTLKKFETAKRDCKLYNKTCNVLLSLELSSSNSKLSLRQLSSGAELAKISFATALTTIMTSIFFYKIIY